jgi:hypothetical protein
MKRKHIKGIRLTLDEDMLRKFEMVKAYLGLGSDAEVVRYLVNAFYRDVVEQNERVFKNKKSD